MFTQGSTALGGASLTTSSLPNFALNSNNNNNTKSSLFTGSALLGPNIPSSSIPSYITASPSFLQSPLGGTGQAVPEEPSLNLSGSSTAHPTGTHAPPKINDRAYKNWELGNLYRYNLNYRNQFPKKIDEFTCVAISCTGGYIAIHQDTTCCAHGTYIHMCMYVTVYYYIVCVY